MALNPKIKTAYFGQTNQFFYIVPVVRIRLCDQGLGLAKAETQIIKQPLALTPATLDAVALVQRQVSFRALPFHVLSP